MLDLTRYRKFLWDEVENTDVPMHYTDDFSEDKGYFKEENNTHQWKIENGIMSCKAGDSPALTFLHIFEKNASITAKVRLLTDPKDSFYGFVLRYNADASHVCAIHHVQASAWSIFSRDCADTVPVSTSYVDVPRIELGTWHDVTFTVDGGVATLAVNGTEILRCNHLDNFSHGKVGIFARNVDIEVDSVDVTFLGGDGVLLRDCVHNKLPDNKTREGGSVYEMRDGKLIYQRHTGDTFESFDNGCTWERRDQWIEGSGYMNVLRLRNGDFIRIYRKAVDGDKELIISMTSSDDGATWREGGVICKSPYYWEQNAVAVNMNDKITEMSDGRIFYCQNYECRGDLRINGHIVFCEFYYSDDCGRTWTKSKTDSWDIPGNETEEKFGECKILECDDGTLRMYNSWNDYGCVVYSESTDRGVTWGKIKTVPQLTCARSSMQFWRDPYAENETTYYMVWCFNRQSGPKSNMPRSRLSLARSYNGKDWHFLGDLWRFENQYLKGAFIAHIVDDFVMTTKDHVICGSGFSEQCTSATVAGHSFHHAQRQHIYSIRKDALTDREFPAAGGGEFI